MLAVFCTILRGKRYGIDYEDAETHPFQMSQIWNKDTVAKDMMFEKYFLTFSLEKELCILKKLHVLTTGFGPTYKQL